MDKIIALTEHGSIEYEDFTFLKYFYGDKIVKFSADMIIGEYQGDKLRYECCVTVFYGGKEVEFYINFES